MECVLQVNKRVAKVVATKQTEAEIIDIVLQAQNVDASAAMSCMRAGGST